MSSGKCISLLLVTLIFLPHPCGAQTDRATLEGTVTDSSGGVIKSANVHIEAVETGLTYDRVTNSNGYYRFPGIAVGQYTVIVTNIGFKTHSVEDVVLQVGQTRTLDVKLSVGDIAEKVLIVADVGPSERSSAEQSGVIGTAQIGGLPLNGRDWAQLTILAPFAQDDGGGDQRTIRFAGRARDDNNFTFDGVDAGGIQEQAQKSQTRLQISADAIAEYRVNSALYTAEYGTQAGGQINVVTKSGTNEYHGTVFGYLRNSVFDARNFNDFDAFGNPAIPAFRYGQYGMTIGGPIVKNKTFFFLNYEGLRQYQNQTTQGNVPSVTLLQDILVNGRTDTAGVFHPAAGMKMCSILQAFPWKTSAGTIGGCAPSFTFPDGSFVSLDSDTDQFTNGGAATVHEDSWLVRIDQKFGERTLLYGRAQRDISLVDGPNGSLNGSSVALDRIQTINHPANYFVALQHLFATTVLNETKVFINRSPFHNPQASVLSYAVNSDNLVGLNNNQADIEIGTTFGVIDNLSWTHGRHTFKTGLEIRRIRLNQGKTASNTLNFTDSFSLIDALLSSLNYTSTWCCHGFRRTFYLPYFQDEWKVTPTFTANLGIRWEYYGVATEATNRTTVFDFNQFHGACLGSGSFNTPFPTPINTPPCPRNPSLYNANYRNFDPRVSFAWAPAARQGKTVIRSGFGIYHGAAQNDDLNAGLESDTITLNTNTANAFPLLPGYQQENPDLSGIPTTPLFQPRALQRQGRRDLYVESWGLTVQHELPANFLISASYLGSHGVRLFSKTADNLCITTPDINGNCTRGLDQYYPGGDPYGSVDHKTDSGTSSYQGLLVTLERRFVNGFSLEARYTFSHSINDGSVGGGESSGPENLNCRQCDKGDSIFDVRHNIIANALYDLPFGPGKAHLNAPGVVGKIVGGWSLGGVGVWHTGHPLTVIMNIPAGLLPDGNDQTTQRPDLIPGQPLTMGIQNGAILINPAAFQAPPNDANGILTRFGNAGNGIIRAPNSWQIDLALMKATKLTERFDLEFAVQMFNIFNHTQLGDPHTLSFSYNYDPLNPAVPPSFTADSGLGIINSTVNTNNNNDNKVSPNTGTGLPRQIQFMLRLRF